MLSRVTAVVLAPALLLAWLAPASVLARELAPPEDDEAVAQDGVEQDPVAQDPVEQDPFEQARQLFDEGVVKFETADYVGAIELWTKAFGIVPNEPDYAPIKAKLIANLAAAQERAYSLDNQIIHLKQAKILLERYRDALDDIYLDTIEREKELAWVTERVTKIDAEVQAVAEREAAAAANQTTPVTKPPPPPGRGLQIGGSLLVGLGVGGLGLMVGGMVLGNNNDDISDLPTTDLDTRAERFRAGRLGNALAIGGGVAGGLLLGAGIALIVVGVNKSRRAKQDDAAPRVTLAPFLGAGELGLGAVGRF